VSLCNTQKVLGPERNPAILTAALVLAVAGLAAVALKGLKA
jgi:hypothetical protein